MQKFYALFVLVIMAALNSAVKAQAKTDRQLLTILQANKNELFQEVLQNAPNYRCQIIYTQINRDKNNVPHFKNFYFNYDPLVYFNPASTVKMPLAFLSLQKLHQMAVPGVDKYTLLQIDSSFAGQRTAYKDSTSKSGFPSMAHYIKKAFLVSDNDAYNRMYEFVGQQAINRNLHKMGYKDARITRQFMGFTTEQNRHTNQFRFIRDNGTVIYTQPPAYNTDSFNFSQVIKVGKAHFNSNDSLVNEPFDFTLHNNYSLNDLKNILQSVLFPQSVPVKQRFDISGEDRQFLLQYFSQFPAETNYPKYDTAKYYDSYVKFFFSDSTRKLPANVRVFNKVGWAYGFMTDVSYVADFTNKVEFMLSATAYFNSDSVVNDNKYDYETKGHPFFRQLGNTIYQYELQRKRPFKPDLSSFKIEYEHRNNDNRPTIKEVDN